MCVIKERRSRAGRRRGVDASSEGLQHTENHQRRRAGVHGADRRSVSLVGRAPQERPGLRKDRQTSGRRLAAAARRELHTKSKRVFGRTDDVVTDTASRFV